MRRAFLATVLTAGLALAATASAEPAYKPFILASTGPGDVAGTAAKVAEQLAAAGFEVVGSYSPYPTARILVVTSADLKQAAAQTRFGAYGAGQRVSVTEIGGQVQVAYTNPPYMAAAYRMASDLGDASAKLAQALGRQQEYGINEAMTKEDLGSYRYMFGMERFSDPHELASHASYAEAVETVEKNLAAGIKGVGKVYRIDVPGREETVFGVSLNGRNGGGTQQDDAYIMSEIDFKEVRSTAHLPYEMVVSGNKVYALSARFRIAINFPDLSMMGSHSFMNIMGSPDAIKEALTKAAGGGES
ncbi:MAG: hypothetical protein H3C38_18265 [Rhodospirillales bacterium]|nr:hypothetical protein [Rhodospirillales bacterium]